MTFSVFTSVNIRYFKCISMTTCSYCRKNICNLHAHKNKKDGEKNFCFSCFY